MTFLEGHGRDLHEFTLLQLADIGGGEITQGRLEPAGNQAVQRP